MAAWNNFFFAQVGASAALVGLIFVAVSINLTKILASPRLPSRAREAPIVLLGILIVSSLMLVPEQPVAITGMELLVVGIIIWGVVTWLNVNNLIKTAARYRPYTLINIVLNQFALVPYIIAGINILTWGLGGLYWLVPAIILSFVKALMDAWVLLVEINR